MNARHPARASDDLVRTARIYRAARTKEPAYSFVSSPVRNERPIFDLLNGKFVYAPHHAAPPHAALNGSSVAAGVAIERDRDRSWIDDPTKDEKLKQMPSDAS